MGNSAEDFCNVDARELEVMNEVRDEEEDIDVSSRAGASLVTDDWYNVPDNERNHLGEWMEARYREAKKAKDAAWEEMRINFLQAKHGKCLFAPRGFYRECGYDMDQAEMLFADGLCGVAAGERFAIVSISSD